MCFLFVDVFFLFCLPTILWWIETNNVTLIWCHLEVQSQSHATRTLRTVGVKQLMPRILTVPVSGAWPDNQNEAMTSLLAAWSAVTRSEVWRVVIARCYSRTRCLLQSPVYSIVQLSTVPSCRPTSSVKAVKGKISHFMDLFTPSSPGSLPTLSLTTNSSWLPWGRVAMPLISPLMPIPSR